MRLPTKARTVQVEQFQEVFIDVDTVSSHYGYIKL